jgi:hypothetical protein
MDIILIQALAVPCERVFSSSKETMTAWRNRISPQLMEALQMLKFSIRQGRSLNFTDGLDWGQELQELELDDEIQKGVPEDINSFIQSLLYKTDTSDE